MHFVLGKFLGQIQLVCECYVTSCSKRKEYMCERVKNGLLLVLYGQDSYDYDLITIIMGNRYIHIDNINKCIN